MPSVEAYHRQLTFKPMDLPSQHLSHALHYPVDRLDIEGFRVE